MKFLFWHILTEKELERLLMMHERYIIHDGFYIAKKPGKRTKGEKGESK